MKSAGCGTTGAETHRLSAWNNAESVIAAVVLAVIEALELAVVAVGGPGRRLCCRQHHHKNS